ncbi:unnamed protein product [Schistosoma turkestanicum]|nr:unnamed protein product [Schistosoma turkestanicum]
MNFSKCHASKCTLITNMSDWREADALVITEGIVPSGLRPPEQLWFALLQESPAHIAMADFLESEVSGFGRFIVLVGRSDVDCHKQVFNKNGKTEFSLFY